MTPIGHDDDRENQECRQSALTAELKGAGDGRRQFSDDARQNDQRDAVADTARGDLLAEPHQEHGAARQRDQRRETEEHARVGHDVACALKTDGDTVSLECRENDGQITGVLVECLAARFALFLEGFELRRHAGQQLNDDRRRNVRHDVQREDRHAVDTAAGEHVEHAENTAGLRLEDLIPDVRVDARQRDVGAQPINKQRTQCEPDALFEFVSLCECRRS